MMQDNLLSIGQVAKRTGANVSAIRYYTEIGVIDCVRNSSGHRYFHRSTIRRISFILITQSLGYTLDEISNILSTLPANRTPTKEDWHKLSLVFNQDIDKKINELTTLKESLSACIGCGCLSLESCQLYNPEDKVNKMGAGARLFGFNKVG